jgi:non-heme chloroperoxidase
MRVKVGRENSTAIELQVDDLGCGPPVLLLHGWPLSSVVWEHQVQALLAAGHRVISYDRRGFGRSSRCSTGFDFDTLAEDLKCVLDSLDMRDAVLVGYGMGCGEIVRYLGTFGSERLRAAALVAPLPPFLRRSGSALNELDEPALEDLRSALLAQRHDFLEHFIDASCELEQDAAGQGLSDAARRAMWIDAVDSGPAATLESLASWRSDFRDDLPRIGLPTLVLQGTADRMLPPAASGEPLAAAISGSRLELVAGAPHGLLWTHAAQVNAALLNFLA